ncbi:hypothetical protein [Clostridium thailandense]|uniref:hypothetical protein n=1 Tax=Clostridium thailandense TaxID=2794346 RepID=UPI0039894E4E
MKIYSNQYDYYNQVYQLNSLLNTKVSSNENSTSSQSETETKVSTVTRPFVSSEDMDISSLNYNGRILANSVKMQDSGPSEISESMEKIKTDMDSIKNADIDNMSDDEVKSTLTQLKTDLQSVRSPYGKSSNTSNIDIDSISTDDMRSMLKTIQEKAKSKADESKETESSESDAFSQVKKDIDSIRSADIDNMSTDDIKKTLTQLKTDVSTISTSDEKSTDITSLDLDTMSEADMKSLLEKIQEQENNRPRMMAFNPNYMDGNQYDTIQNESQNVLE